MADVAAASSVLLAVVFAWAAAAKAARPSQTRDSFVALGIPSARTMAVVVPLAEAALAVGLVAAPSLFAWPALALLAVFTVVLARAITSGVQASCSCFGSARADPVSSLEIVRNGMLAALAVVATGATAPLASWPALPALVIASVAVALGRVVLAVMDFRRVAGNVWPRTPGAET